jgi:hypothetical protein
MKNRVFFFVAALLLLAAASLVFMRTQGNSPEHHDHAATVSPSVVPHSSADHFLAPRVPAFQSVAQLENLPPTLAPAEFVGKAREAYQVAKEIPRTLAQLPCYCECDQAYGHKSLQTCFVDDHASHCSVCVDEALLAYKLQKEDKLSPDQVREKIIEEYSKPPGTN